VIRPLASLLFGAIFTLASAWALGAIILRRLAVSLDVWEHRLFAFLTGAASLSMVVFLICAVKLAHRGVFLALGAALIGYALYTGEHRGEAKLPPLALPARIVFITIFGGFALFYLTHAMAPEMSPDGMAYHLTEVARYARAHGFVVITTDMFENFSQGVEMLFLVAFEFGRHSAAALVHFGFWIVLALLLVSYGRRIGRPLAGVAAALFTALAPVVALDGSVAYVDVALAAVLFGLFYLLQIWDDTGDCGFLIPIGMLAGFAYAIKYTAGLAVPYALGYIAWRSWRLRRPALKNVLTVLGLAAAMIAPWMIKNWIEVANPVSPFANRLFPNPYVHIWQEESWRHYLAHYELTGYGELPLQLTVFGDHVSGFFGPLYLLAPLALLALRFPPGRRLLFAAALFGVTYFGNVGARFLIPVAPFLAMALVLAFADIPFLLLTLIAVHTIASLPNVYQAYTRPNGNWMLAKVSPQAALRLIPEDKYLSAESAEYNVDRMIDQLVPPGERVFSFYAPGTSYTSREVLVSYLGAENELLADTLWTPLFNDFPPTRRLSFRFAPRPLRHLRVIQTEDAPSQQWAVSELRVFSAGDREIPRAPGWSLTANPNPWDVQRAFDNSPATRWRSWQGASPGMYIDIGFPQPENPAEVVVESSGDTYKTKIRLEGQTPDGQWVRLSDNPEETAERVHYSLRRAATYELKARGVRFLLIDDSDLRAHDFRAYSQLWGIEKIGEAGSRKLYYIP